VTRPILKSDAETAIRSLEGVGKIENQIEVLPLSPNDDRIRMATFRAVFSKPGLDRYAVMALPSIHIIVKNGNITLVGVVASEADRDIAEIAARSVSGAFEVLNNLRIEGKKEPGSPAERAGLARGDVIEELNRKPVSSGASLGKPEGFKIC